MSSTTVIGAMLAGSKGKDKTGMNGYPVSWNRMHPPRNGEKLGKVDLEDRNLSGT